MYFKPKGSFHFTLSPRIPTTVPRTACKVSRGHLHPLTGFSWRYCTMVGSDKSSEKLRNCFHHGSWSIHYRVIASMNMHALFKNVQEVRACPSCRNIQVVPFRSSLVGDQCTFKNVELLIIWGYQTNIGIIIHTTWSEAAIADNEKQTVVFVRDHSLYGFRIDRLIIDKGSTDLKEQLHNIKVH